MKTGVSNGQTSTGGVDALTDFCEAVAQDLTQLAMLHNAEADNDLIHSLRQSSFPQRLGLRLVTMRARASMDLLETALNELPQPLEQSHVDELAVDYANIYLTHTYRASPNESVWTDEENLERQQSMFEVREYYARFGLGAADWRQRADDHLVLQLQFLAHLFGHESPGQSLDTAARFMDEHLLRWLMTFADRVANRCATRFYAGINLLTAVYCEELRDLLVDILDQPRPTPEQIEARMQRGGNHAAEIPAAFIPGAGGPSW